ncbi:hypothetical protein T492DRAFT_1103332, partial [Pavlovales sp. CCMP2436]
MIIIIFFICPHVLHYSFKAQPCPCAACAACAACSQLPPALSRPCDRLCYRETRYNPLSLINAISPAPYAACRPDRSPLAAHALKNY